MAKIDRQVGSQFGTSGRTILVVDDSDDLRELYATLLNYEGYEVKTASSAEEADARAAHLQSILDSIPEAMIVIDERGRMQHAAVGRLRCRRASRALIMGM